MAWAPQLWLPLCAFGTALAATGLVLRWLGRRQILAHPNHRSSHIRPTPVGGGLGLLMAVAPAWAILAWGSEAAAQWFALLAAAIVLAAVSWIDDLGHVGAVQRLLAQAAAVAVGLAALPGDPATQGWLPVWLDLALTALAWLWFVNLYNFMDGIDGIAGVETISIGLGMAVVAAAGATSPTLPGLVMAAAAAGFLWWNWHPAKVFMGDVGSVPVGYLLGGLLVLMAKGGAWIPALILPLYFLADATITLMRRFARGERIWQAHREHFYQQAVQSGRSHAWVASAVGAANIVLIAAAAWAVTDPLSGFVLAVSAVAVTLWAFARRPRAA
jgi:UDP-N-acetylmuramyl pentapeptide phosphotransferase/UDP-N-acetylglucosamine-1-phosphate transferase